MSGPYQIVGDALDPAGSTEWGGHEIGSELSVTASEVDDEWTGG